MFNFLKRQPQSSAKDLKQILADIHSHVLPGIDDGSPDIATSLQLINGLQQLGINKLVATPHVIGDMFRNTPATINTALQKVKLACAEAGMAIEISAAAEYMLDDYFMELLRNKQPLLTISKNILLTEISYATPPSNLQEMSFAIITSGYQPIMAHPERYFYYHKNYENYYHLKELGFLLQVNLLSLTGYYGNNVKKAARFLFEKDMVDFVGTDTHHTRHIDELSKKENLIMFNKYLGDKKYNNFEVTE